MGLAFYPARSEYMQMEFYKVIRTRRSIRSYKNTENEPRRENGKGLR